ncbi:glycerophosphoryl diester phosphodiesterase [Deinobacterium chartae]|uniref:Glycerophosphoryl diester phosphodiesterase n=1 Tax=Deinobacterium chartae TaxID=521158 RepID=A0A841HW09_9DEIO|nr:glycerophosphodiester phosphodiesterase [Deinobacterium chartae]MBB6097013.1 glycerophosphoryl diester phosphodiesterase [Deinobacterium chartae]
MLLLGHRGTPLTHTENTLPGFQAALEAGLGGVELDVQPTRDGRFVVMHDAHLPDGRLIQALTQQEIQRESPEVPTLEAVLEWLTPRLEVTVNVELKNDHGANDGRERRLVEVLNRFPVRERIVISCFHPLSLLRLRAADPSYRLGYLYAEGAGPALLHRIVPLMPLYSLNPHHSLVSYDMVRRAHARGLKVMPWTVNDPQVASRLARWGVDGLIGDRPEVLLEAARAAKTGVDV